MDIKPYDEAEDLKAIERIWLEVGWIEKEQAGFLKHFLGAGSCITGRLNGVAECAVHTVPGTICYLDEELALCAVTAVTTSRIARKQGFAQRLTALQLAAAVADGAQVAALGMFEQGFYDKLGFGTAAYVSNFTFDPATLLVDSTFRVPARLGEGDWRDMHSAMMGRLKNHAACCLAPPEIIQAELGFTENGFGLGYYDADTLTHFFWAEAKGEHGPYRITLMAYQSTDQLLELLALIKSLADQVSSVSLAEPPHLQLQTLLKQPFRNRRNTRKSDHGNEHDACAWMQLRVLDVEACLAKHRWPGEPFAFNLTLDDPAAVHLDGAGWPGAGGSYVVQIGARSSAGRGHDASLLTLEASVNAFSRLFFGVASASALTVTDPLAGQDELIRQLDAAFLLPTPRFSWEF